MAERERSADSRTGRAGQPDQFEAGHVGAGVEVGLDFDEMPVQADDFASVDYGEHERS